MEAVNGDQRPGTKALEMLKGLPETALITLAARILAPRQNPDLGFADPAAGAVGAKLGFDPSRFAGDKGSMRGSIVRALWFDGVVNRFVAAHPNGLVVSIGSGLDTRAHRIALPDGIDWIDVDLPEIIPLRLAAVPSLARAATISGDGTAVRTWATQVPWHDGRPVLVLAEGVTMYLDPVRGADMLAGLASEARARGTTLSLALDLASPFMARNGRRNPSVDKTGADFFWGIARPSDLARDNDFTLVETYDVARMSGLLSWIVGTVHRMLTGSPIYSCALFRINERGGGRDSPHVEAV